MEGGKPTAQQGCSKQQQATTNNKCYLDGSVQGRLGPTVVQQSSDGDTIRQVVDEGHIVDEVVCFPDAEYDNGGGALRRHNDNVLHHLTSLCKMYYWKKNAEIKQLLWIYSRSHFTKCYKKVWFKKVEFIISLLCMVLSFLCPIVL